MSDHEHQVALNPLGQGCRCVAEHAPRTYVPVQHHVVPQSWGGKTVEENLVVLCPNAHTSVHRLLDEYVRHGGDPGWEVRQHFGSFVRALADRGWQGRPPKPTITSLPGGGGILPSAKKA